MLKAISFSIGLSSKHAWACWDSARIIDFEFPTRKGPDWKVWLKKWPEMLNLAMRRRFAAVFVKPVV